MYVRLNYKNIIIKQYVLKLSYRELTKRRQCHKKWNQRIHSSFRREIGFIDIGVCVCYDVHENIKGDVHEQM